MTSRKEPQSKLIALSGILGVIAVSLSFLELNLFLFVLLFWDLFALAVCLFILVKPKRRANTQFIRKRNNDISENTRYLPRNAVDSIGVFVKYAAKGSDFSRREIAISVKRILVQRLGRGRRNTLIFDPELTEDLRRVVFPYFPDLFSFEPLPHKDPDSGNKFYNPAALGEQVAEKNGNYGALLAGEAYLASIERIITRLKK